MPLFSILLDLKGELTSRRQKNSTRMGSHCLGCQDGLPGTCILLGELGHCFPVFSNGYSLWIAWEYTLLLRWSSIANMRLDSHKLPQAVPATDLATEFPRDDSRGNRWETRKTEQRKTQSKLARELRGNLVCLSYPVLSRPIVLPHIPPSPLCSLPWASHGCHNPSFSEHQKWHLYRSPLLAK